MAERTSASYMICLSSHGFERFALASISALSSSWSRLPQLTPMRTGLSYLHATSTICANWRSPFSPRPTLPGLMRYFDSASAQAGYSVSRRWPL
jgi:hypothetical protein